MSSAHHGHSATEGNGSDELLASLLAETPPSAPTGKSFWRAVRESIWPPTEPKPRLLELGAEKLDFAARSFHTMIEADAHQDDKANRILSAMAFLATATAVIFSSVYTNLRTGGQSSPPHQQPLVLFGTDIVLTAFCLHIIAIAIGVLFYLNAIGPTFNIPKAIRAIRRKQDHPERIVSLLFFRTIGNVKWEVWENYWINQTDDTIARHLAADYAIEAYLLAQKTNGKVFFMRLGNMFFKLALALAILMIVVTVYPEERVFWIGIGVGFGSLFLSTALLEFRPFQERRRGGFLFWLIAAILTLIGGVIAAAKA